MKQVLIIRLCNLYYGIDIKSINSILENQPITPLLCQGGVIKGLTNVRGLVVPIIDLNIPLNETQKNTNQNKDDVPEILKAEEPGIIVLECENGTLLPFVGIQADGIGKVVKLEDDILSMVPQFLGEKAGQYYENFAILSGVKVAILNLHEILSLDTLFQKEGA